MKKFFAIFFAMMCMTLTSFAGDLLTAAMFHNWSSSGAGAVDNGATGCNYKINDQSASDGLPYGDGNVYYLNYADLTAYSTMEVEFTEGTPRLLFNRLVDQGTVGVEINGDAGMDYVEATEGKWVVNLAAITEAQGFAHLHCIKGANWANATVTRVELFKASAPAPVNPDNMLKGDAFNFEGGTNGGWGAWGELAGESGVVSPGFESDYCFKAVTTGTGDNWKAQAGFTFPAALDQSTEYTLKFMAKGSGTVQIFYQSDDYANQDYKSMFTLTDEWQEFTEKYTPGFDNIVRILFSFGQCTELYVDNIEFVPASAPAPAPTFAVDAYIGSGYAGPDNAVSDEFAAVMVEALGLTGADGEMIEIGAIMPDGTVDWTNGDGRGETDGWRNAEGNWCGYGVEGFTFFSQPYAEFKEGQWKFGTNMGHQPGAVTEPVSFETAFVFKANGKECTVTFTLNYIERPEVNVEVQEEVDVPEIVYDYTLGYAGGQRTFDTTMVEDAIGCSIAEAEIFGFNPTTGKYVAQELGGGTVDGWHSASGDFEFWGETAPFCIKVYNDGTFWYCVNDAVAELGATYKCIFVLVNPETGDAVQYNFTMKDIERAAAVLEDGEYYFYNAEADAWLGGGNSWGTQASFLEHGYPFYVTKVADNVYTIDSYTYNKDVQHFLGANLFIDADATNWTAEKVGKGANDWAFSVDGNYMGYDGSSNILINLTDKDAAGACWTLVTRAELEALLLDAAPDSPVDATFLIQVPNFSRNQAYTAMGQSPWTAEAANKNLSGGDNVNNCAESWQSAFTIYQKLTNLPNGVYRLDAQAALTDYTDAYDGTDYPVVYANDVTTPFNNMEEADRATSMSQLSASFTAGKYQIEPLYVTVTDGTLEVGVKGTRTDTWAIWDNFELTYLGVNVSVKATVEVPAFEYDYALGYDGGEGTYDIATVEETIGCAAADATVYGYNPSTGEFVKNGMDVSDGWHAANGDFAGWGEAPFCLKFYNDGTFWYCAMPDVAELGATYKASWLLVNPRTGDAVQYNFTMNDVTRGPIFAEGEYYLYNEEADAWLGGGNSWGTHATLIKHGMPVYIGECQNGNVYTINTYTYNNANDHYLGFDAAGSGFFVDAPSQGLTFTKVSGAENKYFISANGSYIGTAADAAAFAGSPVDLLPTTDVAQAAQWTLVTRAEREAILAAATPDSPADATFLIQVPNFSRNQAYTAQGQSPWTKEAANCNISGGDNTNNNAESWRSSNGFNVYQTLTNLPTGVYRIDVQGAVCEYANPKNGKDLAVAYANDATTPFVVSELADRQAGNENSMSEMSASFTAGKYQLEPMYVTVTDGTLTVGVKSPRTDTWAVWDNFELTYYGEDYIPAGEYYLYNAEAGAWLAGGNSWGTQASLNKHGMPVYINYEGNNVYSIDTYTYNSDVQHFLGSNLYVDADKTNWTVERVGEGVNDWAFSVDGNYVGYDGSSDILANLTDKNAAGACWTLVTRAERQATLAEATIDNPVDATFYIEVPNFSRNQAYTAKGQSPWTVEAANANLSGGNNTNNNAESWRSSNGFNVYQTLTNLPSGVYELRAQAAVCDYAGTFVDLAYVYANDKKSAFNSSSRWAEGVQENGENSMSAMSESFTAGKYAVKPIHILVTDGKIELGVYSPRTDTWAVWDNFELYYLGQDAEVNHEDPKYTMVATDNVVIEYHATAPQASQAIDATNYLATLGAASAEETQLYAVDTNAGLTLDPLSWVNFTGYFNAEGCVSGLVDAAVKANVDLAGKQVTVEALAETVEPRYHAYAVLACEKTAKAILIAIEVNFVDRPDYAEFTAINNVKADGADAKIFDLSGREVKKATKGVYIINGVKTFVK